MRRGQQQAITFPAVDSTVSTGALKTGLTLLASDVKISKDGGAFASATNAPAELGATGVYAVTLTAAEANCGWIHVLVTKTGMQPQNISGALGEQPAATVVSDAGNSTSVFMTDRTESVNDFWTYAGVVFTSGALKGQVREIASYNGANKVITLLNPLTATPSAGDLFNLING